MPTPLVLDASEVVSTDDVVDPAPGVTVNTLHIVSPSVPDPTLVNGRPV